MIIIVILLVAALFRFYQLPALPPGLNFDEAGNGVAALDILAGQPQIWWTIGGGKEPLWPYLLALSTALLGHEPLALRLPAALLGVLTVAAVYPLARRLFAGRQGPLIALLAMGWLSVSAWHLHFSRLGFRAILLPLLSTLALYFFWRALTKPHSTFYVLRFKVTPPPALLSGLFLALAVYAYLAARLLPLALLTFALLTWLRCRRTSVLRSTFYVLLTALLFLAPLLIHFAVTPADFLARSGAVSIFNPAWHHGDLPGTAARTLGLSLGTFIGLTGDANPLVNLPGQPALGWLPALFFVIGLVVSLIKSGRWLLALQTAPSPHLLLLNWWGVMLLPAILAPEGAPHHLRLIGTLIPTALFIALGLTTLSEAASLVTRRSSLVARHSSLVTRRSSLVARHSSLVARHSSLVLNYLLLATLYIFFAFQTYTHYFVRWPAEVDFTLPFDLYATRLAADIAAAGPDTLYILPMDIRAAAEARHYTLDYLLTPDHRAGYRYLPVDERNAETVLTEAAVNHSTWRVVRWTADKHLAADEKEIVTFLLHTQAAPLGRESLPVYDLEQVTVTPGQTFALPAINQPIGADFDGLLRLDAAYIAPQAAPGGWLPVAITVAPLAPMQADYRASVRLVGPDGARVAQTDRTLRHNFHQGTSLWPPETVNEYYLLPVPPNAGPGRYTVTLVLYHPNTQAPLVANGQAELPLGVVTVE